MRSLLVIGWLLVPVGFGIWHYGPGQDHLLLDDVGKALRHADALAANERWWEAADAYTKALGQLPADKLAESRQVRVQRAKAYMLSQQLPAAYDDMNALVTEMGADKAADPTILAAARSTQANARYYLTWLMRLEGVAPAEWEPEIEAARQTYRRLAEEAESNGDAKSAERHRKDLESAIRLARMEPGELQGLPLPKQCNGCCSGQCKGKKPGNNKNKGKGKSDKESRSAGSGPPPDGSGH
ncbi:MAG: hypothetical protein U1D30_09615 [Planctomycetota bacterium]